MRTIKSKPHPGYQVIGCSWCGRIGTRSNDVVGVRCDDVVSCHTHRVDQATKDRVFAPAVSNWYLKTVFLISDGYP